MQNHLTTKLAWAYCYLRLDYWTGVYATDGKQTLYVRDGTRGHMFHTFTLSNTKSNDATLIHNEIQFSRTISSDYQPSNFQLHFHLDLMYYHNNLYLFGKNLQTCIVYNCSNNTWHPASGSIKGMPEQIPSHLFSHYNNYGIIIFHFGLIYLINVENNMTCKSIALDPPDEFIKHLPRAHTIVKDHYLLVMNPSYQSISMYIIDINDLINYPDSQPNWIKITPILNLAGLKGFEKFYKQEIFCVWNDYHMMVSSTRGGKQLLFQLYDTADNIILTPNDAIHWNARAVRSMDCNFLEKIEFPEEYTLVLVGSRIVTIQHKTNCTIGNVSHVYTSYASVWQDIGKIVDDTRKAKYSILKKIGLGGSSQVYLGIRLADNKSIVIKQMNGTYNNNLNKEEKIHTKLRHCKLSWISCDFYECVRENKRKYLIFEKLGVSLQHLMDERSNVNGGKMSLNQVLGILDRMIIILCKLHSIGYVHNDIKPENILIGTNENQLRSNQLYLIDFGIATPFWDFKNNKHLPIETSVPFNGTFRFSSKNHHCTGFSTSRRDDLESLIYLAIYLLTNDLPWMIKGNSKSDGQNLKINTKEAILEQTRKLKENSSIQSICKDTPTPFQTALSCIQSLKFDETPNYSYLQQLFRELHRTALHRQLITTKTLVSVNNSQNMDCNIASINNPEFDGYGSFLGCYVPIATNRDTDDDAGSTNEKTIKDKKQLQKQTSTPNQENLISQKLTDIAIKHLNAMEKNGTITNHPTHMSVYGMRNRFGDLIDSLTIEHGVPNEMPKEFTCGGIVIYEKMGHDRLNGKIYMLSSLQCQLTNNEYTKETGQTLGGIVHGAIYYYYFKQNIFNTKDKNRKHKLTFIRGFSYPPNGPLKCRSGAFNFVGYKLIDDKYKPLAKCEEQFIDCALKRYWNDNNEKTTTFEQFIQWDQCMSNLKELKVDDDDDDYNYDTNERMTKLVPDNSNCNVDLNPLQVYSEVKLLWGNIVEIIDYLSNEDKIKLFCISKQSRSIMRRYCLQESQYRSQSLKLITNWYYLCQIRTVDCNTNLKHKKVQNNIKNRMQMKLNKEKKSKTMITINIKTPILDTSYSNTEKYKGPIVDLNNWHFMQNLLNEKNKINSTSVTSKYLLTNHHPLLDLHCGIDHEQPSLHRMECDENLKLVLLLKFHGIYDICKDLMNKNRDQLNHVSFIINDNKYILQPEWCWDRRGKWMQYDMETCFQIEAAYQNGNKSVLLSKGMYAKGEYCNLYKILFCGKYYHLQASNQSQIDDIYHNRKWKENAFCKYFYQQNVNNKWVRIVRRKMVLTEESKNCSIM